MTCEVEPERVRTVLERHAAWLRGDLDGELADLRGADLRGADLRGAELPRGPGWKVVPA